MRQPKSFTDILLIVGGLNVFLDKAQEMELAQVLMHRQISVLLREPLFAAPKAVVRVLDPEGRIREKKVMLLMTMRRVLELVSVLLAVGLEGDSTETGSLRRATQ